MDSTKNGATTGNQADNVSIATLLRTRMTEAGITSVSALAAKLDRSVGSVSAVLKGSKIPSAASIPQYAAFLGMSPEALTAMAGGQRRSRRDQRHHEEQVSETWRAVEHAVIATAFRRALMTTDHHSDSASPIPDILADEPSLAEARMAYDAEVAGHALEGIDPRIITLLRRLSRRQIGQVERLIEELASKQPAAGEVIPVTASGNKRSEWYKNRRDRRSRRLSASHDPTDP